MIWRYLPSPVTTASVTLLALAVALLGLAPLAPTTGGAHEATPAVGNLPAGVGVVAAGLTNPRGFAWDAEGDLYLALAGTGGPDPAGDPSPFMAGKTASIVAIDGGCAVPVATDLPSAIWPEPGWIWGVTDVAFHEGELYALIGGAGASFGNPDMTNGLYRVDEETGSVDLVADLAAWFAEHPPAFAPWDYSPDGSLFDLEAGEDAFWVSEAVGGRLVRVTPAGQIELVADLSEDHMVPTGVALDGEGGAYVGHETVVPYPEGLSTVVHVAPDGTVTDHWTGLTAGTDVAMGPDGTLYAAEMATDNLDEPPYLRPHSGRIVRQTGPDGLEPVVTDIPYPVMLGFGPDGALYLTYPAFGPDAGEGQGVLLRVDPAAFPVSLADVGEPAPTCPDGDGAAAAAGGAGDRAVAVATEDFAYAPREFEIPAGTTVTWTNRDLAPHTVTADDGAFDSGRLDQGESFGHTFAEPGTYPYFCTYHPGMTGTVVVA